MTVFKPLVEKKEYVKKKRNYVTKAAKTRD